MEALHASASANHFTSQDRTVFGLGSGLDGTKSDLVGAIVFQPWDNLGLSYQARVEEDLSNINVQEAFATSVWTGFQVSLGYVYLDSEPKRWSRGCHSTN